MFRSNNAHWIHSERVAALTEEALFFGFNSHTRDTQRMRQLSTHLTVGSPLQITFWDHCENGIGPMACVVQGRLSVIEDDYVTVESWHPSECGDNDDENTTSFTIVSSCITRLVVLEPQVIITIDSCEAEDETHCCGQSITLNHAKDTSE